MKKSITLDLHISPEQAGTYFTLPFDVPIDIEKIEIIYSYARRPARDLIFENIIFTATPEMNIVDIGLIAPDGRQVGASGSDKTRLMVSEASATPGYQPCRIEAGEWKIIVGAYRIAPVGVDVRYEVTLLEKSLRLLKGDLHVHTVASDGVHTIEELAIKAKANRLDFLAITDHNQFVSRDGLPSVPGITFIPGVEWTHYKGHANFLGVDRPYEGPFFTNDEREAKDRFINARKNDALITINHPFEGNSSFQFDMQSLPFDCLEVWNGPMRESNLRTVGLWQQLLMSGMRIPVCGGSDYHRDTPFIFLGGPTTCVYSMSAGMSDILDALRKGHAYITFAPNGPELDIRAGERLMGDEVDWKSCHEMKIVVKGLLAGDEVKLITNKSSEVLHKAESDGELKATYEMKEAGFARVEVARAFLPGLPMLPALLSNPIYFTA